MNKKRFYIFTSAYAMLCAVSVFASHIACKQVIAAKSELHRNYFCLNRSTEELIEELKATGKIILVYILLLLLCELITLIALRLILIKKNNAPEKTELKSTLRITLLLTFLTAVLTLFATNVSFFKSALVPLLLLPILSVVIYILPLRKTDNPPENKQQQEFEAIEIKTENG